MASLGTLTLDLIAKIGGFTKPLDKAGRSHKKTAKQIAREQAKIRKEMAATIDSMGKWGAGIAAASVAFGVGMVRASMQATAEIQRNAKMAGISVEAYQELEHVARQYQVTTDALTDGMKELSLRADEFAVTGAGSAKEAFERLGYTQDAVNKKLGDTPALFEEIVRKLEDVDQAAKIRIADEIFGGQGGEQFTALINGGSRALEGMKKEARDLGLVMSAEMVEKTADAKIEMDNLSKIISSQFAIAVAEAAPDLAMLTRDMASWVSENRTFISQDIPGHISSMAQAVSDFVYSPAFELFQEYWELLAGAAVGAKIGAVAGPVGAGIGAILGAGTGGFVSAGRDIADLFDKTLPEKIAKTKQQVDELESRLAMFDDVQTHQSVRIGLDLDKAREELSKYEAILSEQKRLEEAAAAARTKAENDRESRESAARAASDARIKAEQERQRAEAEKALAARINLEQAAIDNLELARLTGHDKALKALEQKQKEELKKYQEAGASTVDLEKLHAEQRQEIIDGELDKIRENLKAQEEIRKSAIAAVEDFLKTEEDRILESYELRRQLIENNVQDHVKAAEMIAALTEKKDEELFNLFSSGFTDAPGFVPGQIEGLDRQRDQLQSWYDEQLEVLDRARSEQAERNAEWDNREIEIRKQYTERLKGIEAEKQEALKGEDFWTDYLESMNANLSTLDGLAANTLDNLASNFGGFFEKAIFDSESAEEAFAKMAQGMARSMVAAIGEMIAQWLVYQLVRKAVGKATAGTGAAAAVANAQIQSLQAGIAAYASAAAIPVTGWTLAPAAMASAIAATSPMVAAISGLATGVVGMAHEGIDSIPKTGSWFLEKGERVTTEDTSKRLDRVLANIESGNYTSKKEKGFNIIINESPITAVEVTEVGDDLHIDLIEEQLTERLNRGSGIAGYFDNRYRRQY